MLCPYCQKKTEHGWIEGGACEMNWKPQKTGPFTSSNADHHEGAVVLSLFSVKSFLNKNRVEAYFCRDCRKIIIDVSACDL